MGREEVNDVSVTGGKLWERKMLGIKWNKKGETWKGNRRWMEALRRESERWRCGSAKEVQET